MPPLENLSLSHLGLFVRDIEAMTAFYRGVLGFAVTDRGRLGAAEIVFLSRDAREHHQIVLVAGRTGDADVQVVNQISFRLPGLADLKAAARRVVLSAATDLDPVQHGVAWSLYFRDPERNRIELFVDTDWYIPQPCRMPLDLGLSDDEIYRSSQAFCEAQPGWRPLVDWQFDFAARLAGDMDEPCP
jgi:catechol 2,3-dioxygenase